MPDDAPEIASADHGVLDVMDRGEGTAALFSCPACGGVLSEMRDGGLLCFRCQVGHRFSPESVTRRGHRRTGGRTSWLPFRALAERARPAHLMAYHGRQVPLSDQHRESAWSA
jgi:two-component system chemotaxis response regulator CheB